MLYEIKVSFSIININQQELSSIEKINNSSIWLKGEKISKKGKITYTNNGWILNSGLQSNEELVCHLKSIIENINESRDIINLFCMKYESELSLTIFVYYENFEDEEHNTPSLHFDKDIIKLLSDLNSELDIDLYVLKK